MIEKKKYKNVSGVKQLLIGFGEVEPEGIIVTSKVLENPNFKEVEEKITKPSKVKGE